MPVRALENVLYWADGGSPAAIVSYVLIRQRELDTDADPPQISFSSGFRRNGR